MICLVLKIMGQRKWLVLRKRGCLGKGRVSHGDGVVISEEDIPSLEGVVDDLRLLPTKQVVRLQRSGRRLIVRTC